MNGAISSNKITNAIIISATKKGTFVFFTKPLETFIKFFILSMPLIKKSSVMRIDERKRIFIVYIYFLEKSISEANKQKYTFTFFKEKV
jgi:hypothetical protein